MKTTYRTFKPITGALQPCEWRWDGKEMKFREKASSGELSAAYSSLEQLM